MFGEQVVNMMFQKLTKGWEMWTWIIWWAGMVVWLRNWDYVSHFPHGWKQADAMKRLNSLIIDGAILGATAFSILAEIQSGP